MPPPIIVPRFPVDCLVPWQREMVQTVARSTQSDPTMAALSSLGVLSAAVANKTRVLMPSGRRNPLHLWVTVIAGPGESKSAVFDATGGPLVSVQEHLAIPQPTHRGAAQPVYRPSIYERILGDPLDRPGAQTELPAPSTTAEQATQMVWRRQFQAANTASPPVLVTNDVTPTRLFDLLGAQASPVTLLSSEAGFDAWLRNSSVAAQEQAALNDIWDNRDVRRDRGDRTIMLRRPALIMIVGMQPGPASELLGHRRLRASGYTLRTVWAVPEPTALSATAPFPPVNPSVVARYNAHVWHMMTLGGPNALATPEVIQVSRSAAALYNDFFNKTQPRLRPGGDLAAISDYVIRLRTNVLRIAGVLHVARWAAELGDRALSRDMDDEPMAAAIQIAETLVYHGRLAFEQLALDPDAVRAPVPRRSFVEALGMVVSDEGWEGRASELLAAVNEVVAEHERSDDWPRAANALSRWLGRNESLLARHNLGVTVRRTDRGSSIFLRRIPSSSS